jgi:hypothetical protein
MSMETPVDQIILIKIMDYSNIDDLSFYSLLGSCPCVVTGLKIHTIHTILCILRVLLVYR